MLVNEGQRESLVLIDRLLEEGSHDELERVVYRLLDRGLLGEEFLSAARALDLVRPVIFLATLGAENLPADEARNRAIWCEVYRSLAREEETPELVQIAFDLPVRWVVRRLLPLSGSVPDSLDYCKGDAGAWIAAFELAIDRRGYDLAERLVAHRFTKRAPERELLLVARVLFQRSPLIEASPLTLPLAQCSELIRKRLPRDTAMNPVRSDLAVHSARYFLKAGDPSRAIEAVQRATEAKHRLGGMLLHAEAYCHKGDLPRSIAILDRLLSEAEVTERNSPTGEDEVDSGATATTPIHKGFDPDLALEALRVLQKVVAPLGQSIFLMSGTLLGYAREGRLLSHDKDVDVGIFDWSSQFDLARLLLESGEFTVDTYSLGGTATYVFPVLHRATRVSIDIFIYYREGDRLITGVKNRFGYLQRFAYTPFGLEEVDFRGIRIHVPDDVDRTLTENFGNWRVPDPDYLSFMESPALMDVGGLEYQLVGRLNALSAIQAGNAEKLRRALDLLDRHRERPSGMKTKLLTALRVLREAMQKAAANELFTEELHSA